VDPRSEAGRLLYNDVLGGTNSTDFNTFLHEVIQDNGGTSSWGQQTLGTSVLTTNFTQQAPPNSNLPNNTINIKPSPSLNSDRLTDFNNNYIDSIKLFNTNKIINSVIESIFGSISLRINKNKRTIETEEKINEIIDRIINADDDIIVDDSFFQFSNEEIANIQERAELRRKGFTVVETCDNVESRISFESISELDTTLDPLNSSTDPTFIEQKATIVRDSLDRLAQESASNVTSQDRFTVQLNFIERMLQTIMKALVSVILSPKLIVILAVNHTIVNGRSFDSVEDFMRDNKVLITSVLTAVREAVVSIILDRVLKEVKTLVSENIIRTQIERVKGQQAQLVSLLGSSTDVLRNISGLR
jgi:hypothetical protein